MARTKPVARKSTGGKAPQTAPKSTGSKAPQTARKSTGGKVPRVKMQLPSASVAARMAAPATGKVKCLKELPFKLHKIEL